MQYSAIVKDCATMLWYRIQQNIAFGNSDDRWCSSYFNIWRDTAACGACLLNNKISTKDIEEWKLTVVLVIIDEISFAIWRLY